MRNESRESGDIRVATGFSRWKILATLVSAVGTIDVCRAYGTLVRGDSLSHRLKPVAKGMSPRMRLLGPLRGLMLVAMLGALTASAQQPQLQPPQQSQQPFTLKVSTQLVIETVVVKDKDGKPIEDLTAKDFTVTEDGVPQTISVFEFQKIQDEPVPPRPAAAVAPEAAAPATVAEPVKAITPEKPGD